MTRSSARSRNGQVCALGCWLEVSMRWVLITAFGVPVEPEVNRNFAIVWGPTAAKASSTASVSGVDAICRNDIASRSVTALTMAALGSGLIGASSGANVFGLET